MKNEIVFCPKRDCPNTDCLRFHKNAPWNIEFKQFREKPKISAEGGCKYFIR